MAERELIDWIKSEEAKGISDAKLKTTLEKRGWPDIDIDKAINLAHKGKVNWMPLIITFFISLILFYGYLVTYLDRIEHIIIGLEELLILLLIGLFGFFLYSLIPYYKSEKKEPLCEQFIIILSSGVLTLIVSTLFFNLLVFLAYITQIPITIPLIIIIPALSIIFLFYVFFLIISKLSRHFAGYFDYESFFVFKHWPFKILDVNWKKKWTLLKYPLIAILIGLIISGFVFNSFISHTNRSMERTLSAIKKEVKQPMYENCLSKIIIKQNISVVEEGEIPVQKTENQVLYLPEQFFDIDLIYHSCNFQEFICQQKSFDYNKKIEEQVTLKEGQNRIKKTKTENKTIIFIPQDYPYNQLLSCSTAFNEEQLKIKIVQESEDKRKNLLTSIFEKKFSKATWSDFANPKMDVVLYYVQLGLDWGFHRTVLQTIEYEWNIIHNQTTDLTEHTNKLNENIKILYPKFLAIKPKEDTSGMGFSSIYQEPTEYSFSHIISFDKSLGYLVGRITHFEKLGQELSELRENYLKEKIQELYQTKDVEESSESKAIRFKIIETLLAKQIIQNNQQQKQEMIDLTQSPELYSLA